MWYEVQANKFSLEDADKEHFSLETEPTEQHLPTQTRQEMLENYEYVQTYPQTISMTK